MLVVGERINTSRAAVREAVRNKDAAFIQEEAKAQAEAGAGMIDVNCGTFMREEPDYIGWLVETVQKAVDLPLCIDSPSPEAIRLALEIHRNGRPLINSITDQLERFEKLFPLVLEHEALVVALCINDEGMPETVEDCFRIAANLVERLTSSGVPIGDIYVDPVVRPISTDQSFGKVVLETIRRISSEFEGVHTICGLSNISFGLPQRKLVNQNFLTMCMYAGLDAVILDPLDRRMMSNLVASETLLGRDEFCLNYIKAHKEGRLTM
ncbi:MAG TPA: methyltetrahydrofolate cobalamin methyltransferase [Candidatus Latescibacteria bacterium]|nr:methyltetrahydrofolate cobalamin methyltransferase [Candidatus Latescibacterota bacterium]